MYARRIGSLAAQLRDGPMRDFVDKTARDCVERLFLLCRKRTELRALPVNLAFSPKLELILKNNDGGGHFARLQPNHHPFYFFDDDVLGFLRNIYAAFEIGFDDLAEV